MKDKHEKMHFCYHKAHIKVLRKYTYRNDLFIKIKVIATKNENSQKKVLQNEEIQYIIQ